MALGTSETMRKQPRTKYVLFCCAIVCPQTWVGDLSCPGDSSAGLSHHNLFNVTKNVEPMMSRVDKHQYRNVALHLLVHLLVDGSETLS